MFDKKQSTFKSPDLMKLQEVIIDYKTKLYIEIGADPKEAKNRYLTRLDEKNKVFFGGNKKPATT